MRKALLLFLICPLLSACDFGANDAQRTSITFQYQVNYGLDCFMVFDCGYTFTLNEDNSFDYTEDRGPNSENRTGSIREVDVDELINLLSQFEFFSTEYRPFEEETQFGQGSVSLSFHNLDNENQRALIIPLNSLDVPNSLNQLIEGLDLFFKDKLTD